MRIAKMAPEMTEKAEYIDGYIYVLRNDNIRYPDGDIGWRESYKRKNSYVLRSLNLW